MRLTSTWKLWLDCTTEENAQKVVARVQALVFPAELPFTLKPYEKGGSVAEWSWAHALAWSDAVVELIAMGQRIGSGWTLSGSVLDDFEMLLSRPSGHVSVSGVTMITLSLRAPHVPSSAS